jgi:NADH:ubiquinone oxidoreductase subunit K
MYVSNGARCLITLVAIEAKRNKQEGQMGGRLSLVLAKLKRMVGLGFYHILTECKQSLSSEKYKTLQN